MTRSSVAVAVVFTVVVFTVVVSGLSGCATEANYRTSLSRWMGASELQLVSEWGVPVRSYQVDDSKFVAFVDRHVHSSSGSSPTCSADKKGNVSCVGGSAPSVWEDHCETTFQLRGGVVVQWQYKGNNCVAYEPRPDGTPRKSLIDYL